MIHLCLEILKLMSLPKSLLTTVLVFSIVWMILVWRYSDDPGTRSAAALDEGVQTTSQSSLVSLPPRLELVGMKQVVNMQGDLSEIEEVWNEFNDLSDLHLQIPVSAADRIFAFYHSLDQGFTQAELIIGYNVDNQFPGHGPTREFSTAGFQPLAKNLSSWDTAAAWEKLDTEQVVDAVVEVFELSASGDVAFAHVFVNYQ